MADFEDTNFAKGIDITKGKFGCKELWNKLKNNWIKKNVKAFMLYVQNGMIVRNETSERLHHCVKAGDGVDPGEYNEILQAEQMVCKGNQTVCKSNEIVYKGKLC